MSAARAEVRHEDVSGFSFAGGNGGSLEPRAAVPSSSPINLLL
jgi:hypothetical protein